MKRLDAEKENLVKKSLLSECQDNFIDIADPVKKAFVTQLKPPVTPVSAYEFIKYVFWNSFYIFAFIYL